MKAKLTMTAPPLKVEGIKEGHNCLWLEVAFRGINLGTLALSDTGIAIHKEGKKKSLDWDQVFARLTTGVL